MCFEPSPHAPFQEVKNNTRAMPSATVSTHGTCRSKHVMTRCGSLCFLNQVQIDGQTTDFVPSQVRSFSFLQRSRCPRLTPPTALTFTQESTQHDPPRPRSHPCHLFLPMLGLAHPPHRNPRLAPSPSQSTRLSGNYSFFFFLK